VWGGGGTCCAHWRDERFADFCSEEKPSHSRYWGRGWKDNIKIEN